ncbi:hypothetical protein ACWY4P_41015 [Streptomyces sp. LZ34]
MPDPSTSRLGLYKSKSDGSELVSYTQDIGQNLDKLDAAVGFQACTSTTRPSTPYSGKPIRETDTARTYVHNGSSPASGGWVQIPNSASTFDADLDLTSGKQLNIGGSGSGAPIATMLTASNSNMISSRVTGDTVSRWFVNADGNINWGIGGSTTTDVGLSRSGIGVLTVTGSLGVSSNLTVTGNTTVTGNLSASGIGQERYAVKAANTTRASTTTKTDDPDLTMTVVANAVYYVEFILAAQSSSTTPNINTAWNVPSGSTGLKFAHGPTNNAATFVTRTDTNARVSAHGYTTGLDYIINGSGVSVAILEKSIVTTGGSGGTIAMQWAQNTSNGTATVVEAGSYMYIRRIA